MLDPHLRSTAALRTLHLGPRALAVAWPGSLSQSGGSASCMEASIQETMTGTPSQIEWATQIKPRAGAEFDRVAAALQTVADRQSDPAREDTLRLISILGEKRGEVMARTEAGYSIAHWQELGGACRAC